MRNFLVAFAISFFLLTLSPPAPAESTPDAPDTSRVVGSLEALLKSRQSKEVEIRRVQEQLQAAQDEVTHQELLEELTKLKEEERALESQFEEFAVVVDTSVFGEEPDKSFDWQDELGGLLKPILAELKSATAESRAIGELRSQIDDLDDVYAIAAQGVENLERVLAANPTPKLEARLQGVLATWQQRRDDAHNQLTALQLQLDNRLAERKSVLDETTGYARRFFQTRGMNLVFGIAAFAAVFFGVRLLGFGFRRVRPRKKTQSFTSRLGSLLVQFLSVGGGLLATLLVFNLVGDWFLLGIVIIFLLGVAWASINTLPQHIEAVKLILNIGAVKENERIDFNGVPWKVQSLGFAAMLVNPLLEGGTQRLPVKYLVGMHSRRNGENEEWFPCRPGDWVELADGRTGRVAYQTPSTVQVVELGGSQVVYQTANFVGLNPRTLSTGFRVSLTFGIDYKHQAVCTTEIPARMQAKLEEGLPGIIEAGQIQHINVDFKEAAASSLDYEVDVDVDGEAASRLRPLERGIARLLVDACNENGWEIPFTQITVHQAG